MTDVEKKSRTRQLMLTIMDYFENYGGDEIQFMEDFYSVTSQSSFMIVIENEDTKEAEKYQVTVERLPDA